MAENNLSLGEAARLIEANDQRWVAHGEAHIAHDAVHAQEHLTEREVTRQHEMALARAFEAHETKHKADEEAIKTALAAVKELAEIHEKAHEREHFAHDQRHIDAKLAVDKAEQAVDKRLEGMNGVYGQMREQQRGFASIDRVEQMQKATDERILSLGDAMERRFSELSKLVSDRYEENRRRIEAIEKGDVKAEGKSLGQGAVVAIIVGAITLVATILGILIVIANFVTGTP